MTTVAGEGISPRLAAGKSARMALDIRIDAMRLLIERRIAMSSKSVRCRNVRVIDRGLP
jgi:hypothetical protein